MADPLTLFFSVLSFPSPSPSPSSSPFSPLPLPPFSPSPSPFLSHINNTNPPQPAMMTMGTNPDEWPGYDMYYWGMTYRWIIRDCKLPDPGTFAVIGMASFMGGSGRISVM